MSISIRTYLIGLCLLSSFWLSKLQSQDFGFDRYSLLEGLPQSQVYAIYNDCQGYLWCGTQGGGVAKFDGYAFTALTTDDGLGSDYVHGITELRCGTFVFSDTKGLTVMEAETTVYYPLSYFEGFQVNGIYKVSDDSLLIGTDRGVFIYKHQSKLITRYSLSNLLDKSRVYSFVSDGKSIYIATGSGLFEVKNDIVYRYSTKNGLINENINTVYLTDGDSLWCTSYDGGVQLINTNNKQVIRKLEDSMFRKVSTLLAYQNRLWIGTENQGVAIFDLRTSTLEKIDDHTGLPTNQIKTITKDRWNNIWIGTSGSGLLKYKKHPFTLYNTSSGMASERIYSLSQASDSSLWLATGSDGIGLLNGNKVTYPIRDSIMSDIKAKSMAHDTKGRLWIGTEAHGLLLVDSLRVKKRFLSADGLPHTNIKSILVDGTDHVWVATNDAGLYKITSEDTDSFIVMPVGTKEGLFYKDLTCLTKDSDENIWFGTKGGAIGCIQDNKVVATYQHQHLLPNGYIRSLLVSKNGIIWVAIAGEGIYQSNGDLIQPKFEKIKMKGQSYSKNIYLLIMDKDGHLWSGSESGVDRFTFSSDNTVTNIAHYGKGEGFTGMETCQNAALLDFKGNLWFGTMNGLMYHPTAQQEASVPPPMLSMIDISLFYNPIQESKYSEWFLPNIGLKDGLSLPYHSNHLSFHYVGTHLDYGRDIEYRYMLEGMEDQWSPPTSQTSVNYASLPPGHYTFKVQAIADGRLYSEALASTFDIKQPYWMLWWFRWAIGILLGIAIVTIFKYRVSVIRKKAAIQNTQLETQNQLLTLEQKALQLQMNPHFIFNALNSIQSLVSEKNPIEAREQISNFAALMRSILSNSRQKSIPLQDEINTLKKYLKMEQFCQKTPFTFTIHLEQHINQEEIEIPSMLLQPFVENAVIHGLAHMNTPGHISIHFELAPKNILICTIVDNGVGRAKATELRNQHQQGHISVGMDVTEKRLAALYPSDTIRPLKITDLYDEKGKPAGTKVEVYIPFYNAFE